jgi:hypothetical protein
MLNLAAEASPCMCSQVCSWRWMLLVPPASRCKQAVLSLQRARQRNQRAWQWGPWLWMIAVVLAGASVTAALGAQAGVLAMSAGLSEAVKRVWGQQCISCVGAPSTGRFKCEVVEMAVAAARAALIACANRGLGALFWMLRVVVLVSCGDPGETACCTSSQ